MVEIPDDVAKQMAAALRTYALAGDMSIHKCWADLLDPQPPTLREQVYDVLISEPRGALERADAVLAVVADWLAAQPVQQFNLADPQRDHDVRLLRGES